MRVFVVFVFFYYFQRCVVGICSCCKIFCMWGFVYWCFIESGFAIVNLCWASFCVIMST